MDMRYSWIELKQLIRVALAWMGANWFKLSLLAVLVWLVYDHRQNTLRLCAGMNGGNRVQ